MKNQNVKLYWPKSLEKRDESCVSTTSDWPLHVDAFKRTELHMNRNIVGLWRELRPFGQQKYLATTLVFRKVTKCSKDKQREINFLLSKKYATFHRSTLLGKTINFTLKMVTSFTRFCIVYITKDTSLRSKMSLTETNRFTGKTSRIRINRNTLSWIQMRYLI